MIKTKKYGIWLILATLFSACRQDPQLANIQQVATTEGLVAFWDFNFRGDTICPSFFDPKAVEKPFELFLKRIGDTRRFTPASWPYADAESQIHYDHSGPFGKAILFNQGYLYGAVDRNAFDGTPLDLHGKQPFTLLAWCKFVGKRHMVAGIWDEGGWDKYAGRRQVALFAGLFNQRGVIAHVSATGAASYPQSTANGSQYARLRAIDGRPFEDEQWIAMAATYDPVRGEVKAYLNGVMTPLKIADPVIHDVYQFADPPSANPFSFTQPIYSPRAFVLKYNGYPYREKKIVEHRIQVDLDNRNLVYEQDSSGDAPVRRFRLQFDIRRNNDSLLSTPIIKEIKPGDTLRLPEKPPVNYGDKLWTLLEEWQNGEWQPLGAPVARQVTEGAPFTFGRALGLGSEELDHGSRLYLDGVAVFDRILSGEELRRLSFGLNGDEQ